MDDKLVTELSSRGDGGTGRTSPFRYKKVFEDACPVYMSMGLSYEDFWDGDAEKARYAREAFRIETETLNARMWHFGKYIYQIFGKMAPVMRAFSKVTQPGRYLEDTIPITEEEAKRQEKHRQEIEQERVQADMREQIRRVNRMIRENKADGSGT